MTFQISVCDTRELSRQTENVLLIILYYNECQNLHIGQQIVKNPHFLTTGKLRQCVTFLKFKSEYEVLGDLEADPTCVFYRVLTSHVIVSLLVLLNRTVVHVKH